MTLKVITTATIFSSGQQLLTNTPFGGAITKQLKSPEAQNSCCEGKASLPARLTLEWIQG